MSDEVIKFTDRTALICGVTGQDGAYLAKLLLDKGYKVIGTSRDVASANVSGLLRLGVLGRVELVSMSLGDFRSVLRIIVKYGPCEIYNLAGQSSVGLSFEQPVEAIESISLSTLNLLEVIRFVGGGIKFYSAGSSECFGDTNFVAANEETHFKPKSPYAVAKVCAHNLISNYRDAYNMNVCTGVLFNHESPLRSERFVSQKIIHAAARIAKGSSEKLRLGNLDVHRDWGWAPEYVVAMWLMLQRDKLDDYVIATGRTVSLQYFVELAFNYFNLDWSKYVVKDESLLRPSDIKYGGADPSKAFKYLSWRAELDVEDVVKNMAEAVVGDKK